MSTNVQDRENTQAQDEAESWHDAIMLRNPLGMTDDGNESIEVLMLEKGKVIADFTVTEAPGAPGGLVVVERNGIFSRKGQRNVQRKLRENGWMVGVEVKYNSLTHETIIS